MSMNILIKPIFGSVYKQNKFFEVDNGDNIFFGFKDKLKKLGITINTIDVIVKDKVDRIVFCDMPFFWEIGYIVKLLLNKDKSILFCLESPVINPLSHRRFFYRFFSLVYTWNDRLVDNIRVRKFYSPVLNSNLNFRKISFGKKKLLCVINSNISTPYPLRWLSPYKKVLYEERLKAINFFEKEIPSEFDLYGRGWDKSKKFSLKEKLFGHKFYLSYRGSVPRNLNAKLDILSKYKFNLCFENCIADGYISEKILDCFKAHTIPIYLGAPNIGKYVPKNCFIDFRKFRDFSELINFLKGMNEETYSSYVNNAKKLLKKKDFRDKWFEDGFMKVFLEAISFIK